MNKEILEHAQRKLERLLMYLNSAFIEGDVDMFDAIEDAEEAQRLIGEFLNG